MHIFVRKVPHLSQIKVISIGKYNIRYRNTTTGIALVLGGGKYNIQVCGYYERYSKLTYVLAGDMCYYC